MAKASNAAATKNSERSVEDIEKDLNFDNSEVSLSSESEDLNGLSSEEESDEEVEIEEPATKKSKTVVTTTKDGHSINKTIAKPTESSKAKGAKRGVIYIGRIPHGFHEVEMRKYFSQFGDIINLRLSRNKKTGASKHYGWIEFESHEVASVAAETMNNYLLEGHLLKVSVLDSIHEDLFKGANTKYTVIDWDKKNREAHDRPKSENEWAAISKKFEQAKVDKQKELKDLGFEYDVTVL